jgi:DNA-binding response OmpR family regulator
MTPTVLLVGADFAAHSALINLLRSRFTVLHVGSLADAMLLVDDPNMLIHALVLDADTLEERALCLCASLRRQGHSMPIVMMAGLSCRVDVVSGLEAGASDYITKPVRSDELLARISAQLRASDKQYDVMIGRFIFRRKTRRLEDPADGRTIKLTNKEADILSFLCHYRGRSVDRGTLLQEVWGYQPGATTHTVETHVFRLRRKLETDPRRPTLLVTAPEGYRIEARWS